MMTSMNIPLTEEQLAQLQKLADRVHVSPEELARVGLAEWLR
jgi:predicted transcriptional regulator